MLCVAVPRFRLQIVPRPCVECQIHRPKCFNKDICFVHANPIDMQTYMLELRLQLTVPNLRQARKFGRTFKQMQLQ